eukprot:11219016-Lingulodinium_polyedra.AAC.1
MPYTLQQGLTHDSLAGRPTTSQTSASTHLLFLENAEGARPGVPGARAPGVQGAGVPGARTPGVQGTAT